MTNPKRSHEAVNVPVGRPGSNDDPSARAQRTWPQTRTSTNMQRAAKAARVHTLTDPLGAQGFRATGKRVRAETGARRKVLLASVATFAASFGLVVATNHLPANADIVATQSTATASNARAATSGGSSVGAAVDLFTGQTANALTGTATLQPTATAVATATTTPNSGVDEGNQGDATSGNASSASLTPQSSGNSSDSSQNVTSNQTNQLPVFQQQPSHTRSGGS